MKTIKYPIKEVDIKTIPGNRILGIGISRNQRALCKKSIRQYGLVMPIVTVEKPTGGMVVLKGDNELSVLKEMNIDKADVFVTHIQSQADIGKAILLLSYLHNELNPISEGLILKEILKFGQCNQKQLSEQLMKSEGWISKRLSLSERLNENVAAMVLSKALCPSIAQNIARIPKDKQHTFAMNILSSNIPKSIVEKLVSTYGNKNTPDALKDDIIKDPLFASENITLTQFKSADSKVDDSLKFQGSLRLLLKIVQDLDAFFAKWDKDKLINYSSLIISVELSLSRFITLLRHVFLSPGKPVDILNGSDTNGCC